MNATIKINPDNVIAEIDPRIYSSFLEHMGRAIYTGIYEPGHPAADENGLRQDVLDLIAPLNLGCIRYPGGNFVSGYRWEDGVGPKKERPIRRELAWFSTETNEFGTNEFIEFCKKANVAPMMAVNLGTRGPQDAANLVEYCNVPSGTYYSDLRRSHGYEKPHDIKLWCLGNEMDGPWQICMKTAEEYGRIACETAKMMKWMDPSIELVLCGSSAKDMPTFGSWERTVLRHCYERADYLSLHQYYNDNDGDLPTFLARPTDMDAFIREVAAICEEVRKEKNLDKQIYLSFDEWNVWFHYQKEGKRPPHWQQASPIEEEKYEFVDALVVAGMINTLLKNSDRVKIACLAQLVNVIAPIMTVPGGGSYIQTIYHPFYAAAKYGRGSSIRAEIECPSYRCAISDSVPYLDASCVLSEKKDMLTLFLINRSLTDSAETTISLPADIPGKLAMIQQMTCDDLHQTNTIDTQPVAPITLSDLPAFENGSVTLLIPAASYQMIRFSLS